MIKELTVYDILHLLQQELKVPKAEFNKFGGFNYRTLSKILEPLKKILPGDALLTLNDEIIMLGDRFYIKATASLRYKNETIEASAFAREPLVKKGMDESQISGCASSYARKYALGGLFLIDDSKPDPEVILDPDAHDNRTPLEKLEDEMKNLKSHNQVIHWLKLAEVKSVQDLNDEQIEKMLTKLGANNV